MVFEAMVAAHEARLRELDPLLPLTNPIPRVVSPESLIEVDGAVWYAHRIAVGADTPAADWGALDEHRLVARVGGPDPVVAMEALLAGWADAVRAAAAPEDRDSAATVNWPSRDTAMTPLFVDHGMVLSRVMAVRPAGRPGPDAAGPVVVRPMVDADLDAVVDLHVEQIRWAAQFGSPAVRRPAWPAGSISVSWSATHRGRGWPTGTGAWSG